MILCIVTATNDFANQEALSMARAVDPDGKRTLGVITKADEATHSLLSQVDSHPLKLGYIAVMTAHQKK